MVFDLLRLYSTLFDKAKQTPLLATIYANINLLNISTAFDLFQPASIVFDLLRLFSTCFDDVSPVKATKTILLTKTAVLSVFLPEQQKNIRKIQVYVCDSILQNVVFRHSQAVFAGIFLRFRSKSATNNRHRTTPKRRKANGLFQAKNILRKMYSKKATCVV